MNPPPDPPFIDWLARRFCLYAAIGFLLLIVLFLRQNEQWVRPQDWLMDFLRFAYGPAGLVMVVTGGAVLAAHALREVHLRRHGPEPALEDEDGDFL